MAEQTIGFTFGKGVDNKTDPWNLSIGSFQSLTNTIFQKGGLLQKRNGYGLLTTLNSTNSYLTTLNNNLVSVGSSISSYSPSINSWITKGNIQPCSLSVVPLIRNNINQIQADSAVSNGLVCTAYTQNNQTTGANVTSYLYSVANSSNGQNVVSPAAIPVLTGGTINGSPRVFVVGNYFVIVCPVIISSTTYIQYVSIPVAVPTSISVAQNVYAEAYVPISSNPGWDGVVTNNTLVVAYNTNAGGQGVHVAALTLGQIISQTPAPFVHSFTNSAYIASILSICADFTSKPNYVYISFWNNSSSVGYVCCVYIGFGTITNVFTPITAVTTVTVVNLASVAQNGLCSLYYEIANSYSYNTSVPSNYIGSVAITSAGSISGSSYISIRSVGLASKAFLINGTAYYLAAYQSIYQPTYFLINASISTSASPVIVAKLAYENGGGYVTLGLPSVNVNGESAQIAYLYKDLVEALNTLSNPTQTTSGGIYSQTGINLVTFTVGTQAVSTSEIANNLHISGGYLSQFDGYVPVEHNFFVWPDSIYCAFDSTSTVTPTGTVSSGSTVITSVSSVTGIAPGMTITGTSIPTGAVVVLVGTTTITISAAATGNHTAETLTIQGNMAVSDTTYWYQVTYEWADNNGYIYRSAPSIPVPVQTSGSGSAGTTTINGPMLRLTQKVSNKVNIVVYRYSLATGAYNQVTSITAPVINDTTIDSWTFVDPYADASIIGNNIIYTTGGVVEDVNAPSTSITTLFDTRLWLVDAEDPNTLWVSKQVIEATPVEMSDLFTIYVAPNVGTVSSTGPITALAPMDDKLIIFKKDAIYYINGVGPNNLGTTSVGSPLGNYSQATFITAVVGCTNQPSILLTPDGLMFQSDKGIWLLNRYNLTATYIGAPVENYNSSTVNSANVITKTNFVLFTLSTGEMLMYDYYYQQWGVFQGNSSLSSCIYQNLHTTINQYGQIFQETPGSYLDGSNPVLMSFVTGWLNLADLQGYQRIKEFYLLAKYLSPHLLQVTASYDFNPSVKNQDIIIPSNFIGSTPSNYGVPVPFGAPSYLYQSRIHTKKQLCESIQIGVQEIFDPSYGTVAGAGFTMSGIKCLFDIEARLRPISGANSSGLS